MNDRGRPSLYELALFAIDGALEQLAEVKARGITLRELNDVYELLTTAKTSLESITADKRNEVDAR